MTVISHPHLGHKISGEIREIRDRAAAEGDAGREDQRRFRAARFVMLFPHFLRRIGMRAVFHRARYLKRTVGTVFVSSVTTRDTTLSYGFTPLPEMTTVKIFLGTMARQPVYERESLVPRDLLAVTCMVDHKVVDGAEAMRFVKQLKRRVQRAEF